LLPCQNKYGRECNKQTISKPGKGKKINKEDSNSNKSSREKIHPNVVAVILLMFLFVVVSVEKFQ